VAKFPKVVSDVAQYQGKTYDAIYGINGIGAIYNREAMTNAGLTAPATWAELLAFCRAAKEKGTPAFAKYGEMDRAGCFQDNPLGTSYEAGQKLAATGRTLGIIQGNWVISLLKKQNPAGTFTLKPLPATDDPAQTIVPAAAGAGYGVNAKAKNPELAMKFIGFLMSPQGMNLFAEKQGGLPALPDTGFKPDASLTELAAYLTQNRTVPFMDQLWPNPKVQQTMLTGIQEVFSKQSTPDKVLAAMDADYKSGA
jgi:raffinose/stachyose/melibiose transport system substrate-binding protein